MTEVMFMNAYNKGYSEDKNSRSKTVFSSDLENLKIVLSLRLFSPKCHQFHGSIHFKTLKGIICSRLSQKSKANG